MKAARVRRVVQLLALLLFTVLFVAVRMRPGWAPDWTHKLFFLLDPLLLVATLLAAHAVPAIFLLSLVTVAVTVLFGRVFCGWFCPFGTLHALAGRFLQWAWPARRTPQRFSPWQRAKYYLLGGFLVMAVFGGHWVCVLDPIVIVTRSFTAAFLPATQYAVEEGSTNIYRTFSSEPGEKPSRITQVTEPAYGFMRDNIFGIPKLSFIGGGALLAIVLGLLLLNRVQKRFWCRYLCPLGGLLGLLSWRPFLRRKVAREACNSCDLCGMACAGAASAAPGDRWIPSECLGCMDCTEACRRGGLEFAWTPPWRKEPAVEGLNLSRRAMFGSAVGGLLGLGLLRATPQGRGRVYHPELIRPPGAREEREFLKRCLACDLCLKVCPTGGLQPAWFEAGLEGIWTPRLVPSIGYCDYTCNLCGQVCPTEAIRPLPLAEKQKERIGLAMFDTTRCLPYAYGRDCIVCEEHCPLPRKAIYLVEAEVPVREDEGRHRHRRRGGEPESPSEKGLTRKVRQPRVDPDLCTGCGFCENVCVFKDRPAVRVSSANESRHPDGNQPILPGGGTPYGS